MPGVLIAIVLTFFVVRIVTDVPFLVSGTEPEPEDFESRYVAHPWLTYLHMTLGAVYVLGAPLQFSERFRTRHYTFHRRLGRSWGCSTSTTASPRRSGSPSPCTSSPGSGTSAPARPRPGRPTVTVQVCGHALTGATGSSRSGRNGLSRIASELSVCTAAMVAMVPRMPMTVPSQPAVSPASGMAL